MPPVNGRARWVLLTVGALFGLAVVHCGDDDHGNPCRPGEPCPCANPEACRLDCSDIDGCIPLCSGTNLCHVRCGDHCQYDCTAMGDCDVYTGAESTVGCSSTSYCGAHVGPESTVDCSNLSQCDVTCAGACEVHSVSVGDISVTCLGTGTEGVQCSDTRWVCDTAC